MPLPAREDTYTLILPSPVNVPLPPSRRREDTTVILKTIPIPPRSQRQLLSDSFQNFASQLEVEMMVDPALSDDDEEKEPSSESDSGASPHPPSTNTNINTNTNIIDRLIEEKHVLQRILLHCLPEKPGLQSMSTPVNLMCISRAFHNIVSSMPAMWRTIYHSRRNVTRSLENGCIISSSVAWNRLCRSGDLPLDVYLAMRGPEDLELFLVLTSVAQRWRYCHIDLWPGHELGIRGRRILLSYIRGTEEEVDLRWEQERQTVDERAQSLIMRRDGEGRLTEEELFPVVSRVFRDSVPQEAPLLESASIDCSDRVSDLSRWLNSFIAGAPRLTFLRWKNLPLCFHHDAWLDTLKTCSLNNTQLSSGEGLEILERGKDSLVEYNLTIGLRLDREHHRIMLDPAAYIIHADRLRTLKLEALTYDNFFDFLSLPALRELHLKSHSLPGQRLVNLVNRSQCGLKKFALHMTHYDENATFALMHFLMSSGVEQSIREISIRGVEIVTREFMHMFAAADNDDDEDDVGMALEFPRLGLIELINHRTFVMNKEEAEEAAVKVMLSRVRAGICTEVKLDVRWPGFDMMY